jgi:hypothetical protein
MQRSRFGTPCSGGEMKDENQESSFGLRAVSSFLAADAPSADGPRHLSDRAQKLYDIAKSGVPFDQLQEQIIPLREAMPEVMAGSKKHVAEVKAEIEADEKALRILREASEWANTGVARLERNDTSRAHRLEEAMRSGNIAVTSGDRFTPAGAEEFSMAHIFVVQHDWAAALGPAIEAEGGDFSLPFDMCAFEFMINGRCVIAWVLQAPGSGPQAVPFVETPSGWFCGGERGADDESFRFAWRQIIAICVALDAEVATHEVVRAPVALNKKRERNGKPPLKDFHVVDLSRRHRVAGPATGSHKSPRLHFRRGHWRHYADHKTWIKWMLVGNPDLGFVETQYRM